MSDSLFSKWSKAAAELGGAAGGVVKKVRADLSEKDTLDKLKKEATEAKDQAKSGDYAGAGKEFAKDAGSILKDVASSLKGAVSETDKEDIKQAFNSAVESSRDKLDNTVDNVKAKRAGSAKEPGEDIIDGEVIPTDDGGK